MCKCGHLRYEHKLLEFGCCNEDDEGEDCTCQHFDLDDNWEPADGPGWEGGFADNH